MPTGRTWRDGLDRRSGPLFLGAGGLLLVAAALNALGAVVDGLSDASLLLSLEGFAGFGGLVLAVAGLVGFARRLTDRTPRLARAGLALVALPAVSFGALLLCSTVASLLGLPSPTTFVPEPALVAGGIFFLFAVGTVLFGVADLWSGTTSPPAGSGLLVFATAWFAQLAAIPLYGFPLPDWPVAVATGAMGMGLLVTGRLLGTTSAPTDVQQPAPESTV